MATNGFKIKNSTNLQPQAGSVVTTEGDLAFNNATEQVEVYTTSVESLTTNSNSQTLTNKTISASSNAISNITNSNLSGSAGISVANGGTGTTTSTGTGSVVLSNSPALVTPALGTPSALVGTNITGTGASFTSGHVTTNANMTGDVTSVGNTTTVAAIDGVSVTGTTGTGMVVFATSPYLITPSIGAAVGASLDLSGVLIADELEITASGSGSVILNVPATVTSYSFVLPAASGSSGQVLTSGGGSAAMTWTTPGIDPSGVILMYGGASAPSGYVLCDGTSYSRTGTYANLFAAISTTYGSVDGSHFNVPDLRGVFARGAGTNGTLLDATGAAFTSTLGTGQNDAFQGHYHSFSSYGISVTSNTTTDVMGISSNTTNNNFTATDTPAQNPITGSNGTVRIANETRPANVSVTYIIKI